MDGKDLINDGSPYQGKVSLTLVTAETPIPPSTGLRGDDILTRKASQRTRVFFRKHIQSFFQYLTGSINADFIDLLSEDVISTNRQSINWDQPDMMAFRSISAALLQKRLETGEKRTESKERDVRVATGIDTDQWMSTLPENVKDSVQSIITHMTKNEEISESLKPVVKALYDIVPEYPYIGDIFILA